MWKERDLIDLENVAYTYSGGELLSEMTLSIASGAFYFLTGPSGSGKTTFLKMCYGALVPTAGNIAIFGQDLRAMTRDDIALTRRRIGVASLLRDKLSACGECVDARKQVAIHSDPLTAVKTPSSSREHPCDGAPASPSRRFVRWQPASQQGGSQ